MSNEEWADHAAERRDRFEREGKELPERTLLQRARGGDELAAQELLLWPTWCPREVIDPEVYDAIVEGALDVAAHVAEQTMQLSPNKKKTSPNVTPLMFFEGTHLESRPDGNRPLAVKERLIELAVSRNDPNDAVRLSGEDLRAALTTDFEKPVPKNLSRSKWPATMCEAEARLIAYVQHKYRRKDRADLVFSRTPMSPEVCSLLVSWSYPQYAWHRDAREKFTPPPDWA